MPPSLFLPHLLIITHLSSDCVLLADVFSQFKTNCFEEFNIFPDIFWTLPSFSYQAWLLGMIETPLEFVKDKGNHFFNSDSRILCVFWLDKRDFLDLSKRGGNCSTGYSRLSLASSLYQYIPELKKKYESLRFRNSKNKSESTESNVDREIAEQVFENIKNLLRNDPQGYQTFLYYLDAK